MDTALSPSKALLSIYLEPRKVFSTIPKRTMAYVPVLLALVGSAAIWLWYYQAVDFAWLQERMIDQNADITDAAQRKAAASVLTRGSLSTMSVASAVVVTPLLIAVLALYFLIAGKALGTGRPFKQWFGFAAWATAPALLLLPVMAVQILMTSNGQIAPEALNPLSLNQLLFRLHTDSSWSRLFESINLTTIWTIVLMAIGLRQWTGRSVAASILVAALPFTVVYFGWATKIALGA